MYIKLIMSSRDEIMNNIKLSLDKLNDEKLKKIVNIINQKQKKEVVKEVVNNDVDKTTEKYKVALKFINKMLENLGKEQIDDLRKFQNIDRLDIIKKVNTDSLFSMENELFEHFDRDKFLWHRRNVTKYYISTFMRRMCAELGLSFTKISKNIQRDKMVETHFFYSIS